ncbi:MAG: MFS transporter [Spirochaetales bacterium]|jgi:DHA1 family multidrug resistance protein-like MFS transporter|nr:MFS transporter [Spirochaetales bacterium]
MPQWKKTFYAILAAELLAIAGFGTSTPIIPLFLQDLGVTEQASLNMWVGAVNFASSFSLALMAPIWGRLADSYGRKSMLLRAMAGGSLVIFLIGFTTTPLQFLILRVFQGAITGTIAAANVLVAGVVPEEEIGFRLGLLQTVVSVGNSLGPLMGGFMADSFGHRITFFATSVLLLLAAFIVHRWVREPFLPKRPEKFRAGTFIPDIKPLFESKVILTLVILAGLIQTGISFVVPILPLYVQQIAGGYKVATTTGIIIGVSAMASAAASAAASRIALRMGSVRLLFLSFFLAAAFHVPQAFAWSSNALLVFRTLTAIMLGMAIPLINILLARNTEKSKQGSIYGLAAATGAVGLAAGPMISAIVAVSAGYRAVFLCAAGILAGSAWLTRRALRSR